MADDFFLSRWSRRKTLARRGEAPPEPKPIDPRSPAAGIAPGATATQHETAAPVAPAEPPPLPPMDSLTPESDFTPFMRSEVDPNLRRQALRTLFQDPRFNVMDGLDVYIDDYSKPDPIPAEWMGRLSQMARLGEYKDPEAEAEPSAVQPAAAGGEVEVPMAVDEQASEALPSDTSNASDRPTEVDDSSRSGGG